MPTTTNDGVTLYYDRAGSGETVTFVGDVGYGPWQWAWQYEGLAGPFETLVWDLRGSGRSDEPPGPYDVDTLASDLEAVLAASGVRRTHLVGVGLGGMIALRYAMAYSRGRSLTLFATAPSGADVDTDAVRALHPETDAPEACEASLAGALSAEFRSERPNVVDQICEWRLQDDATPAGVEAQLAAMEAFDSDPLYECSLPALVCHGLADPVVDVSVGRDLADALPTGTFEPVAGKHLCFIEHATAVTDRLDGFFRDHSFAE